MERGFIKLHRKMLKWKWYDDANTFRLFIHLLISANWEDKPWHKIIVKRGQLVTSQSHLAKELKISRQQVRRAIDNLVATNEITKSTTSTYTIITVCNYDKYQDNNQVNNQRATNEQPTSNQRATTTKEYKRIKRNKRSIQSHKYDFDELERDLVKPRKEQDNA